MPIVRHTDPEAFVTASLPAVAGNDPMAATALVACLSQQLVRAGRRRLFLTTDVANPTSNAIYARIGYRALSDYFHYDFVAAAGA